ncbi:Os04g0609850 [Oryza sativa Japonica Group]|uniref:OSJNBa0085I10.4 protein n=1 Tax=Oryza sativa subsp. japonica TaxID=39947 RepID=Q7XPM2_ORYSJ|nr:Os04g0609850 [Oryza sativa Japonica Group]CAE03559.2 OSJNBa0085I10.4 [Oryza sativa Japonica Group]|eukprot:NP_001174086.1 Os04g0609850 [Oryza sativa Japonica Group]
MAGGSSPSPAAAPIQVRCAGCRGVLAVGPGMTEFICPKCGMAQRLPPQLMPKPPPSSSSSAAATPAPPAPAAPPPPTSRRGGGGGAALPPPQAQGVDPTKIQLPCANCQAVLNVPHGLARFRCPQCGVELAVDLAKLHNFLASSNNNAAAAPPDNVPPASGPASRAPLVPAPPPAPFPPVPTPGMTQAPQMVPGALIPMVLPITDPPEEINEVAIDVEREEDEGGTVGETFTDYRPPKLSLGLPHPDPIVETSSLSAVQPPEPTYSLNIMDELDETKALSCLQIETLVYACQRDLYHLPTGDRAGFFIGDGAGVGKGRTIAGLIWENWQQGKHKAVWVSIGSDLKYDARRDLDDVGAKCVQVHPLNKLPYSKLDSKAIGIKNGCHKAKNLIPDAGASPLALVKLFLKSRLYMDSAIQL